MRVHEQRDVAADAINDAIDRVKNLRCRVGYKIRQPYPDGSMSDMVNATSDVLPQLVEIIAILEDAAAVVVRTTPRNPPLDDAALLG
ncbi:hypothetical protein UFOVP898_70 [uncultured Caudovirales phage]|uniref:Uncharacterized protein n=1 Tax=uncultured Caudovirales phage TaxID=2100421 RepID=A0A6J5QLI9_9CAUD|nr:hypothetical protein UFOVP898_70 [uncultured Caudovirales phage]CAB4176814.1 hypothetical protein UFOVP985_63 [uncultured Caudovirales phage]CAB4181848.1 hypothetical protein UFOVP1073_68 [uncultured Caudovirales phage]CAB4197807.1 hypothetical protein UFOVP1308_33 [uncultured Caudovirales phage]CAB4210656.1 hypothetical protein UFOVP1423_36 [uncultured Caudovirales phage]